MKLQAQKQLHIYISFWDIKVLKASLAMPGHAWQYIHINLNNQFITNKYEAAYTKSILKLL